MKKKNAELVVGSLWLANAFKLNRLFIIIDTCRTRRGVRFVIDDDGYFDGCHSDIDLSWTISSFNYKRLA